MTPSNAERSRATLSDAQPRSVSIRIILRLLSVDSGVHLENVHFLEPFLCIQQEGRPINRFAIEKGWRTAVAASDETNKLQNIRGNILWVLVLFEGLVNVKFANKKISHVV
jgi:hypothetical protein